MKCFIVAFLLICIALFAAPFSAEASMIESIQIPSDGSSVYTVNTLLNDILYKVVISGLYRYDVGEPGEFADAQYREDDNDKYSIRYNSVGFNGIRLDADIFDLPNHTHTFSLLGSGGNLSLRIYDEPNSYSDNEGFLDAEIYEVPEPITLLLLSTGALMLRKRRA